MSNDTYYSSRKICLICGLYNIPERMICKRCRKPLPTEITSVTVSGIQTTTTPKPRPKINTGETVEIYRHSAGWATPYMSPFKALLLFGIPVLVLANNNFSWLAIILTLIALWLVSYRPREKAPTVLYIGASGIEYACGNKRLQAAWNEIDRVDFTQMKIHLTPTDDWFSLEGFDPQSQEQIQHRIEQYTHHRRLIK